jgi:hypothetical protein
MLQRPPRPGLPPIPPRMRKLQIEERGYPVPWFVQWIDGRPDFRVMDHEKWLRAVQFGNCWLCGEQLGKLRTFVIGPMCAITRTTSEPGNHQDCAEFAALACPFMTLPKAQYRKVDFDHVPAAGMPLARNPGCACLWTTLEWSTFKAYGGNPGTLIHLGEPRSVRWFAEGRSATREEIMTSVEGGYPLLEEAARAQSQDAVNELTAMRAIFSRWLPA